jgi:hypothetical protein
MAREKERDDLDDALDAREKDDADDDDPDDADLDDDSRRDDDSNDDDDDKKPPTLAQLQAENERLKRNLRRARRDAKRPGKASDDQRTAARGSRPATGRADARRAADDGDDSDDAGRRPTEDRKLTRAQTERSQAKGEVALIKAGADADLVELAVGKLGADDVDWSDRDDVADWVDEMKDRYPALFAGRRMRAVDDDEDEQTERRPRKRAASVDQAAGGRTPRRRAEQMSFGQRVMAQAAQAEPSRRRGR